jgi:hypothetical protein
MLRWEGNIKSKFKDIAMEEWITFSSTVFFEPLCIQMSLVEINYEGEMWIELAQEIAWFGISIGNTALQETLISFP